MNKFVIGKLVQQPQGYKSFIPSDFPPQDNLGLPNSIMIKHTEAIRLLGKLDGITELLPDKDLFLLMFIRKDAASSSQIEGTNATMMDAIESENAEPRSNLPNDVDDILHYISALNYGLERLKELPFSLRLIRELHKKLMSDARSSHNAYPGEFRRSQNWIGGTRPDNARFVPPPADAMNKALDQFEKFIHDNDNFLPLIKAGLLHSQFETIHPFNDGNGRTGRIIITMFLWQKKLLEMPILYLSSYFKKYQQIYYEKLNNYHNGDIFGWLDFFLDGITETALSSIKTCSAITKLRENDMIKVQTLNRTASEATVKILEELYKMPIVGIADVTKWTNYTPRGAYRAVDRLVNMNILYPVKSGDNIYAQKWVYRDYIDLFNDN
ncbi:MAG: Fic family protein [Campylobacteraceae bacterium]|jgi:Fic family protein|nr:Fic family protein [Campylobacteraceae bacterium]